MPQPDGLCRIGPARFLCSLLILAFGWTAANGGEPLHQRIDRMIAAGVPDFDRQAAGPASDSEFLRRVYLDLIGTIPTAAAARAFLADPSTAKREDVIDQLLGSPEHASHLQNLFDVLLMERRPSKHVPQDQWREYLKASFMANKPWDHLVREILATDGDDPQARPAARFYLDREGEPHLLTKDISRLFLGRDYACNQCHDSPVVSDFTQEDYYGLYAFVHRSFLFADPKKRVVFAEKAEGEVTFESVFEPGLVRKTGPRLPGGPPVEEPVFAQGQEYEVRPAKDVRPIPKFSRRAQLAPLLASAENPQFRRNIANRLWALMMGRGLVHPVDMNHDGNPPSHPELLHALATEFALMNFDIRAFLRELALSETYQRSSVLPTNHPEIPPDRFVVAPLKPLSPEQLAASLLQATGMADAERQALGKKLNEQTLQARLASHAAPILALFSGQAGQPDGRTFEATLDQALFVRNSKLIQDWLSSRPGSLIEQLSSVEEPACLAEELYLRVLSRHPSAEEQQEVADYLQNRKKERTAALRELAWALLASAEFRFNH